MTYVSQLNIKQRWILIMKENHTLKLIRKKMSYDYKYEKYFI